MSKSQKHRNGGRRYVAGLAAIVGILVFAWHAFLAVPSVACLNAAPGWERLLASSFFGTVPYLLTMTAFSTIRNGLTNLGPAAPSVLPTFMAIYVLSLATVLVSATVEPQLVKPPAYCHAEVSPAPPVAAPADAGKATAPDLTVAKPDHRRLFNWLTVSAATALVLGVLIPQYVLESYLHFVFEQVSPHNPKAFGHHLRAVKLLLKLLAAEALLLFTKTVIAKWFGLDAAAIIFLFLAQTVLALVSTQLTLGSDHDTL